MNSSSFEPIQSNLIKAEALRLGFSACGIAPAAKVDERRTKAFTHWLEENKQANMTYMGNHIEKRMNPALLMEGVKSIVSVALNYYPSYLLKGEQYQFAWYAYGKDYHDVMKAKLADLQEYVSTLTPLPVQSRVFCDTAPVLERYWAWRAGLGWIGKNTQLIIPRAGSTFFLGELFIDQSVDKYDSPVESRCGNCTRCIDACPTQAIEAPYKLDSGRCLSYLTIEHKEAIPETEAGKMGNKIYGCDDCQKACPWNRFAIPTKVAELQPSEDFLQMNKDEWGTLTEERYRKIFKGSAVKRAKYSGLMRNIEALKNDSPLNTDTD